MVSSIITALLIEDNPGDARLLREYLLEIPSVQINLVTATTLKQGLIQIQTHPDTDIVLLDLSLPDSHGIQTLEQVQALDRSLPILVLTGMDDEDTALQSMQMGAQDYLVKGQFTGDLLIRSIRYAIERKRVAEDLRRAANANLMLAQAVAASAEGIIITDPNQPDNPIIYTNPAFSEITGYSAAEVVGKNCRFLQGEHSSPSTVELMRLSLDEKKPINATLLNYRKDGQPFWNNLKLSPIFSDQGELLYYLGIQNDVTEQKRTEEKLRQQAALIDISTDAILVQDLEHRIQFWSKGAERLYGWSSSQVVDQPIGQFLYPEGDQPYLEIRQELLEKGTWQGELEHLTQEQTRVIVESRWTLVRDSNGQPHSFLVVNTDITEKKQLEAQFLRAQRLESIGTLASGIAHDLNNVLAPILMSIQLLQRKFSDDPQAQRWLKTIETSTRRGADLVKQVLSFSRGIEGERSLIQIRHLIAEVEQIARETFPRSIDIETDVATNTAADDLWPILADATQIHQVLMNLCVNARDAMPTGGTLRITAQNFIADEYYARMHLDARVEAYVQICVADEGVGIPANHIDRIFEPFYTTKRLGKGTGLGLSTALGIVKNHGGFIDVYSEPGQGTEFKIYLPATPADKTSPNPIDLDGRGQGQGELVLVADDEAALRQMALATLETHNYQVVTAQDGVEAIALYAEYQHQIQVVLVDMMMPMMDGITTIRTLTQINPDVKIVAMSGLSANQQSAAIASPTVKAFLAKPYTTETLLTTLRHVLDDVPVMS